MQSPTDAKTIRALVGDIGGTNARFAIADLTMPRPRLSNIREYPSHAYTRAVDAVRHYIADSAIRMPDIAVIAVAGPVTEGEVRFTNLGWTLRESDLVAVGASRARLLNDFESLALAAQHLEPADWRELGEPRPGDDQSTLAVIGPGTGFGASALVRSGGLSVAMAAEGGHASFAPSDEIESEVLRILGRKFAHVSIERILSGPGLANLHAALNAIEGLPAGPDDPSEITRQALAGEKTCSRSLDRFCAILGAVAGDFALCYGARAGVFIAGGIAPAILPVLEKSRFRDRFEAKGRLGSYLAPIPTRVIVQHHAAFLGAGVLARRLAAKD